MNQDQLNRLDRIRSLLTYATDVDHWCEHEGCCIENPICHEMHGKAALKAIDDFMEPEHVSYHPSRLTNDAERIYAERWQKENERHFAINGGFTLLEWILTPPGERGNQNVAPSPVTQRDAHVAASVAQWLGTTCGQCFINAAEKGISDARAFRNQTHPFWAYNYQEQPRDVEIANVLLADLTGDRRHAHLVRMVSAGLSMARKEAVAEALKSAQEALAEANA